MGELVTWDQFLAMRRAHDDVLAALRRQLRPAAQRRPLRRRLTAVVLAAIVGLLPLALLAAGPFGDLNPGSVHNPNIEAIAAAGITKGCDPGVAYCPNASVTREEMASFLARTAGLGGNPPVANALTAVSAQTVPDGTITAAKLSGAGATPGQALVATAGGGVAFQTLPTGGTPASEFTRTIFIHPTADSAANGQALRAAVDGIADATSQRRVLVKLEPGTYNLGTDPLTLKKFVSLEGAGRLNTSIFGSDHEGVTGTLVLAGDNELRALEVIARRGTHAIAVYVDDARDVHLTQVQLIAQQGANTTAGLWLQEDVTVEMFDSLIVASGGGQGSAFGVRLHTSTANVTLSGSQVLAGGGPVVSVGVFNVGSTRIYNSRVRGDTRSLQVAGGTLHFATTEIHGPVLNNGGLVFCQGSFHDDFTGLTNCS